MIDDYDTTAVSASELVTGDRQPVLIVVRGQNVGEAYPLVERVTVIGRGTEAMLRLNEDGVSRLHCHIRKEDRDLVLEDLGSRNGTFCNGVRVVEPRVLALDDRLQIGTTVVLWFTSVPTEEVSIGAQSSREDVAVATRIQSSILPQTFDVEGLEISASMVAAGKVSGDYYDVISVHDGCWIGIGDVTGHGMGAGLVMMMIQSMVATLVHEQPDASPRELLRKLNELLYDNIRNRLQADEHVTLTMLRYTRDGRVRFAGAHEEIVVWRAARQHCERIPTPGTWLGMSKDIDHALTESSLQLAPGDLLVLYTDGIIEAMNANRQEFTVERLEALIERGQTMPASMIDREIQSAVARWTQMQPDDRTLIVLRYYGA